MARRKKRARRSNKSVKSIWNIGNVSFIGIMLVSLVIAFFSTTIDPLITTLILAILGAIIAIQNIAMNEELGFMISVSTLIIVILGISLSPLKDYLIPEINYFLSGLIVAFGVAGLIVALGKIMKISWD